MLVVKAGIEVLRQKSMPLQGPAWGGCRFGTGGAELRYQEGEQASDGDTGEYSGPSSTLADAVEWCR